MRASSGTRRRELEREGYVDFAAHHGRVLHGQALSYAVANWGADHMYATFYSVEYLLVPEEDAMPMEALRGKAERLIEREIHMTLNDAGDVGKFTRCFMDPDRYKIFFGADFDVLIVVGF